MGTATPISARIALAAIAALVVVLGLRQVGTPDVGFHLSAGSYILAERTWPDTDTFTYTLNDKPYIDTSWGYQVLLTLAERAAGSAGLVLFQLALVLASSGLVWATVRLTADASSSPLLAPLLLLGVLAAETRFEVRPEWVSYVLLGAVLYLLHRRRHGLRAPLWLLPAIHLVWANLHGLFVLGWIAVGCALVATALAERRLDRPLAAAAGASVLVTLLNPYGLDGALFPLTLATRLGPDSPFRAAIAEFLSPFGEELRQPGVFYPSASIDSFRALALLSPFALIRLRRRRQWLPMLLWLAFLPLSLRMIRNIPLFSIACLPGLVWGLTPGELLARFGLDVRRRGQLRRLLAGTVAVAAVVLSLRVVTDAYYIADRRSERFGLGWNALSLPVDAAAFARDQGYDGRVLNQLGFGGYLHWAGGWPVFIDGRLEVVGERFYEYYRRALADPQQLERAAELYDAEWVILPYERHLELAAELFRSPRWSLSYRDHLAAIYVRPAAAADTVTDPAARPKRVPVDALPGFGAARGSHLRGWFDGLVRRQRYPLGHLRHGFFEHKTGDLDGAYRHWSTAIAESDGRYGELYRVFATVLWAQGDLGNADRCLEMAVADAPGDRHARDLLDQLRRVRVESGDI